MTGNARTKSLRRPAYIGKYVLGPTFHSVLGTIRHAFGVNICDMASHLPTTPVYSAGKPGVRQNGTGPVLQFGGISSPIHKPTIGLLSCWKDISAYLNKGVRTVQRWEQTLGLPVHRIGSGNRAPVFAFKHEIDTWLQNNAVLSEISCTGPVRQTRDPLNSHQQWLIQLAQELCRGALQLEQELSADRVEPNVNITLLRIQKLVNAALAGHQLK
jgi:hypothetical protein